MPSLRAGASAMPARLRVAAPWAGLALLAFAVYLPALGGGFIWDDDSLTGNPLVRTPAGLARIWLSPHEMPGEQHYWPMVYTSFWLEHLLAGLNPFIYHLDNVLLHVAVTLLLWRVLMRLGAPGAWLAAALFAVHPVHAESVAWVIERKDVLSGALYLGAALAYLRFECGMRSRRLTGPSHLECGNGNQGIQNTESRIQNEDRRTTHHASRTTTDSPLATRHTPFKFHSAFRIPHSAFYALAFVLFALALLSKSVVVTLPVALGLAVWWRRGRLGWRDAAALLPLALLAIAVTLGDLHFHRQQQSGAESAGLGLPERLQQAGGVLWVYLAKLAWPHPLATFYPKWTVGRAHPAAWIPLLAWAGLLAGLWLARRRAGRGPFAAAAFYTVTLAPALGLVHFDFLELSWVADRFQYLAAAGPLALIAGVLQGRIKQASVDVRISDSGRVRRVTDPTYSSRAVQWVLVLVLGLLCLRHAARHRDTETLFRANIAAYPHCWPPYMFLGLMLNEAGRGEEAVRAVEDGMRRMPRPEPRLTLALARILDKQQRPAEADHYYRETVRIGPDFAEGRFAYGAFLALQGALDGAVAQYQEALRLRPNHAMGLMNLGLVYQGQGKLEEAEASLARAVELEPGRPDPRVILAQVLLARGRPAEAIAQCQRALSLAPDHEGARMIMEQAQKQ